MTLTEARDRLRALFGPETELESRLMNVGERVHVVKVYRPVVGWLLLDDIHLILDPAVPVQIAAAMQLDAGPRPHAPARCWVELIVYGSESVGHE